MRRILLFLVLVMVTTLTLLWYLSDELPGVEVPSFGFFSEENPIIVPNCQLDLPETTTSCTIKIGIINTYTRGSECFSGGEEHERGYKLALMEINNQLGGIQNGSQKCQVELIRKNDQGIGSQAGEQVAELVNEGAVMIIGAYSSGATSVAAEEADRLGIPIIVPSASSELITALGYEWVFRINATSADYVSQAMAYTATLSELPTIAVIYENTFFGESAAVAVTSQAEDLGISVVGYESYQRDTTNFGDPLMSIRRADPDVIYLVASSITDATELLKTSQNLAVNPMLFIANAGAFVSPDLLDQIGSEAENVVVTAQWSADVSWRYENGLNATDFVNLFRQNYNDEVPGMRSVQTYTSLLIAQEVIEESFATNCGDTEDNISQLRRCIRNGLRRYEREQTLFGDINFDDTTGQNEHPVLLVQIVSDENGGYRLATIYPERFRTQEAIIQGSTPR